MHPLQESAAKVNPIFRQSSAKVNPIIWQSAAKVSPIFSESAIKVSPMMAQARKVLTERAGSAGEGGVYFFIIPRSIWATTAYSTPATGQMIQLFAQSFVQKL